MGTTNSTDLRTEQPAQAQFGGGESDGWFAEFNLDGPRLVRASYWGGSGRDTLQAAALHNPQLYGPNFALTPLGRDELLFAGSTNSANFPLKEPVQASYGGGESDAWLSLFSASSGLVFSSYYGGEGADDGVGIGQAPDTQVLLSGNSSSPTLAGLDTLEGNARAGGTDAFVARLSTPALNVLFRGFAALDAMTGVTIAPVRLPGAAGSAVTLRARSSNPALFTVSFTLNSAGEPEISRVWNGGSAGIYVHGLASEGTADLIISADGFAERRFPVTLRPLSAQFSISDRNSSANTPSRPTLKVGRTQGVSFYVSFAATSEDQTLSDSVYYPRVGVVAPPLVLASDSPSVLSVLSGTFSWTGSVFGFGTFLGDTVQFQANGIGTANLTASLGGSVIGRLPIVVEPIRLRISAQAVPGFVTSLVVFPDVGRQPGDDLPIPLRLTSEDPQAALLIASGSTTPSASVEVPDLLIPQFNAAIQLVTSAGAGPVRISARASGAEDLSVEIPSSPPRFGFAASPLIAALGSGGASISLFTPSTTSATNLAITRAEPTIFRLRSENPNVIAVNQELVTIAPGDRFANTTLRALTQTGEADIIVEGPPGLANAGPDRVRVRIVPAATEGQLQFTVPQAIGKDLQGRMFYSYSNQTPPSSVTVTSGDPRRLLISTSTVPGSASVTTTQSSDALFLQALAGEGTVTITLTAPGRAPETRQVRLAPALAFWQSGESEIIAAANTTLSVGYGVEPGTSGGFSAGVGRSAEQQLPRPGGVLPRVEILNSNPEVGTVAATAPYRFTSRSPGVTSLDLRVDGVVQPRQRLRVRVLAPQLFVAWDGGALGKDLRREVRAGTTGDPSVPITLTSTDPSRVLINGQAQVILPPGQTSAFVEALTNSGFVRVNVESPGFTSTGFEVDLAPSTLAIARFGGRSPAPLEAVLPAQQLSISVITIGIGINQGAAGGLRSGLPPLTFEVISSNPSVVASPGSFTMSNEGGLNIPLRALAPGEATLEVKPPGDWTTSDATRRSVLVRVRFPKLGLANFALMNGFQTAVGVGVEGSSSSNLEVPLTVRSTNPEILRVALPLQNNQSLPASPGQSSITLPIGATTFIAQAFGAGEATIEVSGPGLTPVTARASLAALAFAVNNGSGGSVIQASLASKEVPLSAVAVLPANTSGSSITYRADAPPITLTLDSSDATVAVADVRSTTFPVPNRFLLRLLRAGSTTLRVSTPGGAPSAPTTLTVTTPPITMRLPQIIGRDLVGSGLIDVSGNDRFTVTSGDASRLTLSTSPDRPGTGSVMVGRFEQFYLHALAGSGTVEILAEAPGYAPTSGEVRLAPSGVVLRNFSGSTTLIGSAPDISLGVALVTLDPVNQNPTSDRLPVRPGVSLTISITNSTPMVGFISTSSVVLSGNRAEPAFTFAPRFAGTTTISASNPPGYTVPRSGQQINLIVVSPSFAVENTQFGAWLQNPMTLTTSIPGIGPGVAVRVASDNPTIRPISTFYDSNSIALYEIRSGQNRINVPIAALAASGEGTLTISADAIGFTRLSVPVRIVPSGFIFDRPSAFLSTGTRTSVVVKPVALDPTTLTPISPFLDYLLAPSAASPVPGTDVLILSSQGETIARATPNLIGLREGLGSQQVQIDGRAAGNTVIRLNAPARFTPARTGGTLEVRVQ